MNHGMPRILKSYEAVVKREQCTARVMISAVSRREAVHKLELWFWYEYKGKLGQVHKAMIVSDPYEEVHYGPDFRCSDRMNKFLPPDVIERLIQESRGELMPDTREGVPHSPPNSVRRVRRRRDFGVFVAPGIRRMKNNVFYYRITIAPQQSRNGHRLRKRKYRDVRLTARTLPDAIKEIRQRRLEAENQKNALRSMKVRSLVFTSHVAGLTTLNPSQRDVFSKVLPKYEEPRPKLSVSAL